MATPRDEVRARLHRFGLERDRLRATLARALDVAPRELDALEHLEADGPLTQQELGRRLVLTSGGVTVLVDRLERAGLVERTPHPSDRRALLVRTAARADERIPPPLARYHEEIAEAACALSTSSRSELAGFLEAVTAAAARAADELAGRRS